MELSRAHQVLVLLQAELADRQISQRLDALTQALTASASASNPSNDQQLKLRLDEMYAAARDAPSNDWVPSRRAILKAFNLDGVTGNALWQNILLILERNRLAPATAASDISQLNEQLKKQVKHVSQLVTDLTALNQEPDALGPNEVEIGLVIPVEDDKQTFDAMQSLLREWNRNLDNICRTLTPNSPPIRVNAISTGSLELYLILSIACAEVVIRIANSILDMMVKIQTLRTTAEATKGKFPDEVVAQLESHIDEQIKLQTEKIRDDLITDSRLVVAPDAREDLRRNIRFIAREIDRGVSIEVSIGPIDDGHPAGPNEIARLEALREKGIDLVKLTNDQPRQQLHLPSTTADDHPTQPEP